ncbi:MAG: hypothetical protein WAT39_06330 [Planctomycetota bacterium]
MNPRLLTLVSVFAWSAAAAAQVLPNDSPYQCLTLRSNGQSGITCIAASAPSIPLSPVAFTAADFTAACGGAPAAEVPPYPVWCQSLNADPLAKWIGIDSAGTARSTLFCQPFQIPACGVQSASLKFSFCVDDYIGDPFNGPNPIGVFLNGQPVAGFGGLGPQVTWTSTTIAPLLVGGQNRLQVYVRDNGAGITGVMYSATICYVGCRADEVITLRSGNGPIGGPDSAVRMLAGFTQQPIATTPANLALASSGPPAVVVAPSPFWCASLGNDPQAKWISTDVNRGPRSALYAHAFTVNSCTALSANLAFAFSVSSWLGDPGGAPSVGLFVNQYAVPLSFADGLGGGGCNLSFTASVPTNVLNLNGGNTLYVYARDIGHLETGVLYSATLTVKPCPPPVEIVTLRSGNGAVGFPDSTIRYFDGPPAAPLSGPVFTPFHFVSAFNGPAARVVANAAWAGSLVQDPQAKWVSSTFTPFSGNPGAPRTALFAHPFTINTATCSITKAKLVIHYHADDGLGDPAGGGGNPMGLYLNTNAIPGTAGDITTWPGTNVKTITVPNVAPWLVNGANTLYVYQRDRNGAVSGVMYSVRIEISSCDWLYFGNPGGVVVPNTLLSAVPRLGGTFDYQIRGDSIDGAAFVLCLPVIGLSDEALPGGLPLPLDLGLVGGTGCQLLVSNDSVSALLTGPDGTADLPVTLPLLPQFAGTPLFFQTLVLDARNTNPMYLSATRGIAVDMRL